MLTNDQILQQTKEWIEKFVIRYNLCPFAKKVWVNNQVHFYISQAKDEEALLNEVLEQLFYLESVSAKQVDTSFIVLPTMLSNFSAFLDFLDLADSLLLQFNFEGVFQLASFHPQFQFADTPKEELSHYTNRSPFPLIHLLREQSIEEVLKNFSQPDSIYQRNINLMNQLGLDDIINYGDGYE